MALEHEIFDLAEEQGWSTKTLLMLIVEHIDGSAQDASRLMRHLRDTADRENSDAGETHEYTDEQAGSQQEGPVT